MTIYYSSVDALKAEGSVTGAGTPPTIVQSKASVAGGTGITLNIAPTNGNILVAMWWSPNVSVNGVGWTQVAQTDGGTDYARVVYKVAGPGELTTQSPWNGDAGITGGIVIWELSGQAVSAPIAAATMGNATTTVQFQGPPLPGVTNKLALHGIGGDNTYTTVQNAIQDQLINAGTRKVYAGHSTFPTAAQVFGVVAAPGTNQLKCGVCLVTS